MTENEILILREFNDSEKAIIKNSFERSSRFNKTSVFEKCTSLEDVNKELEKKAKAKANKEVKNKKDAEPIYEDLISKSNSELKEFIRETILLQRMSAREIVELVKTVVDEIKESLKLED